MSGFDESRKKYLDEMFNALSFVANGNYVFVCDIEYDVSRWASEMVEYFDLESEYMEHAGEIWSNYIHPDDRQGYIKNLEALFNGTESSHDFQYRARAHDGRYVVCTCLGTVIRDIEGKPLYFVGSITNHGNGKATDYLTGLSSQNLFFLEINYLIRSRLPSRILMLGFTRFSQINNIYGYTFGNRVLQHFARMLQKVMDKKGKVYRLDGSRFGIITRDLSVETIERMYKILYHKAMSYNVYGTKVNLAMCCGLLDLNNFLITDKTVFSCLSYAYEESKYRRQGDLVLFKDALDQNGRDQLLKINTIRKSINGDYHGFYLKYQPIVKASDDSVIGAEALIRWHNERFGDVRPDEFIPILENDSLFPTLGLWIIEEAVRSTKKILRKMPHFRINVNVSYSQFERTDFIENVLFILKKHDFPPENLCLEITERCRLLDHELLKNIAASFRENGIKIALDDFGTGFSSLDILKKINFDYIKIDKSFINNIATDYKEQLLVDSVTKLALVFGAQSCVEGIETESMRDAVKQYSVSSMQGYFYSKPVVFEEFWEKFVK